MAFWGSVIFPRLGAHPIPCPTFAKVAELVDAQDLGSCGFVPWGFESPLSHYTILGDADAAGKRACMMKIRW